MMPIISKTYCSSSQVVLVVRRRPRVVNGGGFVVIDCAQKVVFMVEGCGVSGKKDQVMVKDGDGDALLLIRRKGGLVEALSIYRQWKGYTFDYERCQKSVFRLKEPNSCLLNNTPIKISVDAINNRDFEIKGDFRDKECSIVDNKGNVIAEVGVKKEIREVMVSNDVYHVVVKPGIDQAFVFGVIAVLDYIYDGSTRC